MGYQDILASRNYNFAATVTAFVADTEKRMTALAQQSTQDLIELVQTPVAKGGKMRVDTGFLRASGQISFTGMPSGPSRGDGKTQYTGGDFSVASLAGFQLGQTIYFGWTAEYAKYREAYDGFLISGVQNWQAIVDRNCALIIAQSPANKGQS